MEKIKPEEFSILGLYGNKEVFEERLREGFTDVSFGKSPWVKRDSGRIVGFFVFFHPDGRIATYEHPKSRNHTGATMHGEPLEREFKEEEDFQKHIDEYEIELTEKASLAEVIDKWEG